MYQLVPVQARTTKQILKRLYAHYTGDPLPERTPLAAVAQAMLKADRACRIVMLGQTPNLINHVILTDPEGKRLVDINPFLRIKWEPPSYLATLATGAMMSMEVRREVTIESFIEKSELLHTFARRIDQRPEPMRTDLSETQDSDRKPTEADNHRTEETAAAPTLKSITARVRRETGCDIIELERGPGYFYWIYDDGGQHYETEMVYSYRLNHMPFEMWVRDGVDFVERMERGEPARK